MARGRLRRVEKDGPHFAVTRLCNLDTVIRLGDVLTPPKYL